MLLQLLYSMSLISGIFSNLIDPLFYLEFVCLNNHTLVKFPSILSPIQMFCSRFILVWGLKEYQQLMSHIHEKEKKNVQKMIKCSKRVRLEKASMEEEQDKVRHRLAVSDSEESLNITQLTQRKLLRSPSTFSLAMNFIDSS